MKRFFGRIDHFLFIGSANRRFYENYGVLQEKLHAAPYCVDNDMFGSRAKALLEKRQQIRCDWGIPHDAFCVLLAGKLIPKKRPFDILAALQDARLQSLGRPLHVLFAGSGELNADLQAACRVVYDAERRADNFVGSYSANPRIPASFTGFLNQSEISKAYVAADCLVLPSDHRETWGLVVNEALASGLPCIASDACGCSEDLIAPINSKLRR